MRSRNWCVTNWREPEINTEHVVGYVYKKEICPETKREHWHTYIEYDDKTSLKFLKKTTFKENELHAERRRGTQKQAIDYVIKEETKAGEPVYFGRWKQQGERNDIDEIMDDIREGCTLKEILYQHGGNALRMIHAIEKSAYIHHGFNLLDKWIECCRIKDPTIDQRDERDEFFYLINQQLKKK